MTIRATINGSHLKTDNKKGQKRQFFCPAVPYT